MGVEMTEAEHIQQCIEAKTCHCSEPLDVRPGDFKWHADCPACYDGAPDSGTRNHHGFGDTPDAAVRAWAECIDPWPELAECSACEQTVTADRATAASHHGFGYPICDGCVDAP